MTIISNIPLWVWPLFVLLLVVGLRATRPRRAPLALIMALPLLGVLSLRALAALPSPQIVWSLWALGLLIGVLLGYRLQARWLIARQGAWVQLRGEWLTLVVMMVIFWSNFTLGMATAIAPGVIALPVIQGVVALILGACAGTFLGRAIRTFRA